MMAGTYSVCNNCGGRKLVSCNSPKIPHTVTAAHPCECVAGRASQKRTTQPGSGGASKSDTSAAALPPITFVGGAAGLAGPVPWDGAANPSHATYVALIRPGHAL